MLLPTVRKVHVTFHVCMNMSCPKLISHGEALSVDLRSSQNPNASITALLFGDLDGISEGVLHHCIGVGQILLIRQHNMHA
eukprot:Skav204174  [mRNA]  locus=scaffold903:496751:498198:+ [translate_table: standard]